MDIIVNILANAFCKADNWIIFALVIVNVVLLWITKKAIKKTEDMFNPKNDKVNGVIASMQWNNEQISTLKKMRKNMVVYYTWYVNITAIFPLLGILGMVAALFTYSDETMMENLNIALGTTLLSVFSAIIFKALDAKLAGPMDVVIEDADFVIQEYNEEKRHQHETTLDKEFQTKSEDKYIYLVFPIDESKVYSNDYDDVEKVLKDCETKYDGIVKYKLNIIKD